MVKINTKLQAKRMFGTYTALAMALGVSKQAVANWPDRLTKRQRNEVLGAAIYAGKLSCKIERVQ